MAGDDQEKTESATSKRRREAREEGQVARSPEVLTAFLLAGGLLGLRVGAGNMWAELSRLAQDTLGRAPDPVLTRDAVVELAIQVTGVLVRCVAPVLAAGLLAGVLGNVVQVGFAVSWKALTANPERLNPVTGFQNLFQKAKLVDLAKTLIKVVVIGWAAYSAVRGRLGELPFLSDLSPQTLLAYLLDLCSAILRRCLIVYLFIAAVDYAFQRWQYEQKLKMSKEEIKEEYKESEGDPLIKSRIRALQREMARRRMMAEVPKADVVVTNPTHFAVALRYDVAEMDAPRVTAKGADLLAEKIKAVARENGVPVYQDPVVARALYREVEIGQPIPAELFQAVAEILAHIYRLSGKAAAQGR